MEKSGDLILVVLATQSIQSPSSLTSLPPSCACPSCPLFAANMNADKAPACSFFFPPELPVTGANMNYVIAVEAVVLVVAVLTWVFDSRKTFKGPLDIDRLLARFASHYVIAPPLSMPRSRSASTSSRINSPAHIPEPQPDLKT